MNGPSSSSAPRHPLIWTGLQSSMLPGQQARVHRATCHVAALEIEDSTQRAVALHIADNFAGTVAELLDITKAINDPR